MRARPRVQPGRPAERRLRRPRRRARLRRHEHDTTTGSGNDLIYAGDGDDIVFGQQGDDVLYGERRRRHPRRRLERRRRRSTANDVIDGGTGNDLIAGDNARVLLPQRRARPADARPGRHDASTARASRRHRRRRARHRHVAERPDRASARYAINLLDHSDDDPGEPPRACGATTTSRAAPGSDEIFGQLGNDVIQGDGYVDGLVLTPTRHRRDDARLTVLAASRGTTAIGCRRPVGARIGAQRLAASAPGVDEI